MSVYQGSRISDEIAEYQKEADTIQRCKNQNEINYLESIKLALLAGWAAVRRVEKEAL